MLCFRLRAYFSVFALTMMVFGGQLVLMPSVAWSQTPDPAQGISQQDLQQLAAEAAANDVAAPDPESLDRGSIQFFQLLRDGGVLMIPIAIMSLIVLAVAFERFFALRRARLYPRHVRREVHRSISDTSAVTPQALYEVSQKYPSAASRIMEDALQKVGRYRQFRHAD